MSTNTNTDPRQEILAALVKDSPPPSADSHVHAGYKHAVIAVCYAIETTALGDELWSASIPLAELTPQHRIGEHLAATRRHFGLIP